MKGVITFSLFICCFLSGSVTVKYYHKNPTCSMSLLINVVMNGRP